MSQQSPITVTLVEELPTDPDEQYIPPELRQAVAEGKRLWITDPETGQRIAYTPRPGEWGAIHRARENPEGGE